MRSYCCNLTQSKDTHKKNIEIYIFASLCRWMTPSSSHHFTFNASISQITATVPNAAFHIGVCGSYVCVHASICIRICLCVDVLSYFFFFGVWKKQPHIEAEQCDRRHISSETTLKGERGKIIDFMLDVTNPKEQEEFNRRKHNFLKK